MIWYFCFKNFYFILNINFFPEIFKKKNARMSVFHDEVEIEDFEYDEEEE